MSSESETPAAVSAMDVAPRVRSSNYPEPFALLMAGRLKRSLGDYFGIQNFGVNITILHPGAQSSLHHTHSRQDEFVYVLAGRPTLFTDAGEVQLAPGMCSGFRSGGTGHHLVNNTSDEVVILEVGDRSAGDAVTYPRDDIQAQAVPGKGWVFMRKDGTRYG